MTMAKPSDIISPDHRHVAKMVGTALALTAREGLRAYAALSAILTFRLSSEERQGLAWAALKACEPDQAQGIFEDLFVPGQSVGTPWPALGDAADEADWWAGLATDRELRAYAMACLARIPESERHDLVAALAGRQAA